MVRSHSSLSPVFGERVGVRGSSWPPSSWPSPPIGEKDYAKVSMNREAKRVGEDCKGLKRDSPKGNPTLAHTWGFGVRGRNH